MFTGIVESQGRLRNLAKGILEIELAKTIGRLKIGSSLAVNGVCLTVIGQNQNHAFFNVAAETLRRTTFGSLKKNDRLNLERPLSWKGRVEGHFVLGHVDGVGVVHKVVTEGKGRNFLVAFASRLRPTLVEKGSVAVNGVSLTIGKVRSTAFWIHVIPHTLRVTNLGSLSVGTHVNLEADLLAKLALKRRRD